jgi:hypothetical protein
MFVFFFHRLAILESTSVIGGLDHVPRPRELRALNVHQALRDLDFLPKAGRTVEN